MSFNLGNALRDAFDPHRNGAQQAFQHFDPKQVANVIEKGVNQAVDKAVSGVRAKIPGHVHVGEAVDIIKIAQPDSIDIDVFAGFGVSIGVELDLQFGMGITIENPVGKAEALVDIVNNPPETVHQLCDRLWKIAPADVRIHETVQAVVGETGAIHWNGQDVMDRVVKYLGHKNWLEKRLRP